MKNKIYSPEFKQDTVRLIIDNGYSVNEVCQAVGVSESAIRKWMKRFRQEQ